MFFVAFLFRFLCGYDYMTTIVLCCMASVVYYGLKFARNTTAITVRVLVVGFVACLAFTSAVSLQAMRIANSFSDGVGIIWMDAQKRTIRISTDERDLMQFACANSSDAQQCISTTTAALNSSAAGVLAIYLLFRDLLPWLNQPGYDLNHAAARELKRAVSSGNTAVFVMALQTLHRRDVVGALLKIGQCLCGIGLMMAVIILTLRDGRRVLPFTGLILFSLMGAASWFVIAKEHSYVHTFLNYVLWNVGFIPYSVLYLIWRWQSGPNSLKAP
jgi:hypothetical protein